MTTANTQPEEAVVIQELHLETHRLSTVDLAAIARRINDYCRKPLHEINEETSVTHGELEVFFLHHWETEAAQGGDHYGDCWEMIDEITEDSIEITYVQTLAGDEIAGAVEQIQQVLN